MTLNDNSGVAAQAVPVLRLGNEIEEAQTYDIAEDRDNTKKQLENSPEIDALTSMIDVSDLTTIVTFGSKTAEEISKVSDTVLRSMNLSQLDDSGEMMKALAKIMDRFKIEEVRDNPSFLGKLFGRAQKNLDNILAKYHTMGDEVDKIYVQLRMYEEEIKRSNQQLEMMFRTNIGYFHELEKYIVAGEQGCKEIAEYMTQLRGELDRTGDQTISFELQSLQQALTMLEQRTQDLRLAEAVAMQSIPMLKMIQFTNMNLVRKINSAFIVTLPVFKQALAQAIMLKRQKIQADAMAALDARTNEILKNNARNSMDQAKIAARMASTNSIGADTLEATWHTIIDGIGETQKIREDTRLQRDKDREKLEALRRDYLSRANASGR